jgi:hypothetical protein
VLPVQAHWPTVVAVGSVAGTIGTSGVNTPGLVSILEVSVMGSAVASRCQKVPCRAAVPGMGAYATEPTTLTFGFSLPSWGPGPAVATTSPSIPRCA